MILLGEVRIGDNRSYLYRKETKREEQYYLLSDTHIKTRLGEASYPVVEAEDAWPEVYDPGYVVEGVKRQKISGTMKKYRGVHNLIRILDTITFADEYTFSRSNIRKDKSFVVDGNYITQFEAEDSNLYIKKELVGGELVSLYLEYRNFTIHLAPTKLRIRDSDFEFTLIQKLEEKQLRIDMLKTVSYQELCQLKDMSWYEEDGEKKKDYSSVSTINGFEEGVMLPLCEYIVSCKEEEEALITLDTETDGLNTYNLAEDNPYRSHCVSIQLSWKENQGVIVYCDMAHFDNVPADYAVSRLAELFEEFSGVRTVTVAGKQFQIQRSVINLTGHNFSFDRRTLYGVNHKKIFFNSDTLQMAFILSPRVVRGAVGLKNLTHRLFGHDTPELSEILGKGNEDKFRYLEDETVVQIYGCADVDYGRAVFKVLRDIMPDSLYRKYKKQDVLMENILAISEFYGMATQEDKVLQLANSTKNDLEVLKDVLYQYVGAYISYSVRYENLKKKLAAGLLDEAGFQAELAELKVDPDARYEFALKASALIKVLYGILGYPILGYTEGKHPRPKTDKYVIAKLISKKRSGTEPVFGELKQDIISTRISREEYNNLPEGKRADYTLVSAKEFNKCQYPVALIVQRYAELNKDYTSYYKPILEQNLEGKMFYSYSMARIETRRIMNPGQTMKGELKAMVKAYSDDYYLLDFDMSQVEYRGMVSLAGYKPMIQRMKDPENDYHVETAALVHSIKPHLVSRKLRKHTKCISFGVPYGLGVRSLCANLFGKVTDDLLVETNMLLYRWYQSNQPIIEFLEGERDSALKEQKISKKLRDFMEAYQKDEDGNYVLDDKGEKIPIPLGFSKNIYGFYRVFDLSNMDNKKRSSIRRAAGNYPIQSFAAELFRIILSRFYRRCQKEGLEDKVIWHMLIHDELLCSVHKSVHPFHVYKMVKEACMITPKDHTTYFVGINIGNTWAECKDDEREAPVYFVNRMIQRWDAGEFHDGWVDDPWKVIQPEREQYVKERIGEVLKAVQPGVEDGYIDTPTILEKFVNYTVRSYVNRYPMLYPVDASKYDPKDEGDMQALQDEKWCSSLASWALDYFGEGKKMRLRDGSIISLHKGEVIKVEEEEDLTSDLDYVEEDDEVWSFDESGYQTMIQPAEWDGGEEEEEMYQYKDSVEKPESVTDVLVFKSKYQNIKVLGDLLKIYVRTNSDIAVCKKYLTPYQTTIGYTVVFEDPLGRVSRWVKVKKSVDLVALDNFVTKVGESYAYGN